MHVAVGFWLKSLSRRLLKRAIVNVQAPGDRKKSLSLMVKIQVKYQQNWQLRDSLLLFVFFQCQ